MRARALHRPSVVEVTPRKQPVFRFEVRSRRIAGLPAKGCYATYPIAAGDLICVFDGPFFSKEEMVARVRSGIERNGDDPLEIGVDAYLDMDEPYIFFNHSCDPNAVLAGVSDLIALRAIKPGDEITFDYSINVCGENPYVMTFQCECGARRCRRRIAGVSSIPIEQLRTYYNAGGLQDYIRPEVEQLFRRVGKRSR